MATTRLIPMHVIKGQSVAHTVHSAFPMQSIRGKLTMASWSRLMAVNRKPLLVKCFCVKKNMRPT